MKKSSQGMEQRTGGRDIANFDRNDVFNSSSIGGFEFADGSTLTTTELLARGFDLVAGDGNDTILGTNTTDRINGLEGNDTLLGVSANDETTYAWREVA